MASNEDLDWKQARDKYLDPLLERYPHGEYAARAREYIDRIDMAQAEKRLKLHAKRGVKPESEGERLFGDALHYEDFGDRLTALEKYRSIPTMLPAEGKDRPFVKLAEKRAAELMKESESVDARLALINKKLDEADNLEAESNRVGARNIWTSIVRLYGDNRELQPLVERAQQRLSGDDKSSGKSESDEATVGGADSGTEEK